MVCVYIDVGIYRCSHFPSHFGDLTRFCVLIPKENNLDGWLWILLVATDVINAGQGVDRLIVAYCVTRFGHGGHDILDYFNQNICIAKDLARPLVKVGKVFVGLVFCMCGEL